MQILWINTILPMQCIIKINGRYFHCHRDLLISELTVYSLLRLFILYLFYIRILGHALILLLLHASVQPGGKAERRQAVESSRLPPLLFDCSTILLCMHSTLDLSVSARLPHLASPFGAGYFYKAVPLMESDRPPWRIRPPGWTRSPGWVQLLG